MEESLHDRTRVLRDDIAKSPYAEWKSPGSDASPQLDSVMITLLDYVHHLEARIGELEKNNAVQK